MRKTKLAIFTLLMLVFTQACGTIMQGTTQEVGISSNPSKASVTINGQDKGVTPVILDLKRKDSHLIRIELDGYEAYETTLTRKVSGWVWGNIVFGGLIGLAVDAVAGGMYKLTPEQITAELRNGNLTLNENDKGFFIAIVLKPNSKWEKIGSFKSVSN